MSPTDDAGDDRLRAGLGRDVGQVLADGEGVVDGGTAGARRQVAHVLAWHTNKTCV